MTSAETLAELAVELARAPALVLLLDYDGTLVPFFDGPEHAVPDPPLLALLARLAGRPATAVHVVSGRAPATLERWLGALPVWLHAEHGYWSRPPGGSWQGLEGPDLGWRARARPILDDFVARTAGASIEEKPTSLAWHYRRVEPEFGRYQVDELRRTLRERLCDEPVELLDGELVLELRPRGVDKGRVVAPAVASVPAGAAIVAVGDDRTDEDLFTALPPHAVAIHVGGRESVAQLRVHDWRDARALLERIVAERGS
jgi:trehalose 6-phosphate synthase/phosphatase